MNRLHLFVKPNPAFDDEIAKLVADIKPEDCVAPEHERPKDTVPLGTLSNELKVLWTLANRVAKHVDELVAESGEVMKSINAKDIEPSFEAVGEFIKSLGPKSKRMGEITKEILHHKRLYHDLAVRLALGIEAHIPELDERGPQVYSDWSVGHASMNDFFQLILGTGFPFVTILTGDKLRN